MKLLTPWDAVTHAHEIPGDGGPELQLRPRPRHRVPKGKRWTIDLRNDTHDSRVTVVWQLRSAWERTDDANNGRKWAVLSVGPFVIAVQHKSWPLGALD